MWKAIGTWALKIGIYALGHQGAVDHIIMNAGNKNITAVVRDVAAIQASGDLK